MIGNVILVVVYIIIFTLWGYYGMDKWLAACGMALVTITGFMTMLLNIKDAIIKAIKEDRP